MIASGGSMLDVAKELKQRGVHKVILVATFSLFSNGVSAFQEAFQEGLFDSLYTTNLTYVPDEIKKLKWYHEVDCSLQLAEVILEHCEKGIILDADINQEQKLMKEIIGKK